MLYRFICELIRISNDTVKERQTCIEITKYKVVDTKIKIYRKQDDLRERPLNTELVVQKNL